VPTPAGAPAAAQASGLPAGVTVMSIRPIYSPGQVAAATFLGSPLAGGWLLALNYQRFGEPRKARVAFGLCVAGTAALLALAYVIPGKAASALGVFPVFAMYGLANAVQGPAFASHVAHQGRRGSVWRVLGVSLASLAIVFALLLGGVIALEYIDPPDQIMVGESNVIYADGATRADAIAVGDALTTLGYLGEHKAWTVQVRRDHGRRVVAFVVQDLAFADHKMQSGFRELATELSSRAFANEPVDVWLADDELEPHVKLTWDPTGH
jgi:hypothetical protein